MRGRSGGLNPSAPNCFDLCGYFSKVCKPQFIGVYGLDGILILWRIRVIGISGLNRFRHLDLVLDSFYSELLDEQVRKVWSIWPINLRRHDYQQVL